MSDKEAEAALIGQPQPMTEVKPGGPPPPQYPMQPIGAPTTIVLAPQAVPVNTAPQPNDHLVLSVVVLFCCFWPLGIVALIKSLEVRSAWASGDLERSERASKTALLINKIGIGVGIATIVLTVIITVLAQLSWLIPFAITQSSKG